MPTTTGIKPAKAKRNEFTKILALALAPAGEAVTVADCDGFIIEANEAVERVYRWPRKEILGQHPLKFCPDTPEWSQLSEEIWRSINRDGSWDGVVVNKDAQGVEFPILLRARRIVWDGVPYTVSWARPFPVGTPFALSAQQAHCFLLLAQGFSTRQIATQMDLAEGTVKEQCRRIWGKTGRPDTFSAAKCKRLAVRCLEGGWDPAMKINARLLPACETHPRVPDTLHRPLK